MKTAIACAFLAAAVPLSALAQVNKCVDASGKVTYQAEACPGAKPLARPAAPGAAPQVPVEHAMICTSQSDILQADIEATRRGDKDFARTYQADKIRPVYVRDCSRLGYRIPDTPENIAHNKALARDSGPPVPSLAWGNCPQQDGVVRIGIESARRGNENESLRKARADQTRDFVRDCSRFGYRIPDSPENIAHNEALTAKMQQDWAREYQRRKAWEAERQR